MSPTAMEKCQYYSCIQAKGWPSRMWQVSRGISILSVAGKVLAKIMLTCLLEHGVDLVLPESQCVFRRGRSTINIFVAWQLQEKCCTTSRLILGLRWSDKSIWYSQTRPSLEHCAKIWLPSHFHCHTTTISYRYVCSSCHGWLSVVQLSC